MKILVSYRGIPQSRGWATGDFVVKAFQALGHKAVAYGNYYQTQERLEGSRRVLDEPWDLYLQMECGDGDPFYSELIGVDTKKKATWWFDIALYPDRWERQTSLIKPDVNFVANKNYTSEARSVYLPYAADREKHFRPLDFPKSRDFALVGSDRPERRTLIDRLKIAGYEAYLISNVYREQYVDALASTKFVINDIAGGGEGLIPMRPFEVFAAGSCLITPANDGVQSLGFMVESYHSIGDLSSREVDSFGSNDIIKILSGLNQKHALNNHTYENRCQEILKTLYE